MYLDQPNQSNKKATVLLSGGIDSTACVHLLINQGFKVRGIFIDYGQAAKIYELDCVNKLQQLFDIDIQYLKVSPLVKKGAGELLGRNAFLISSAIFLGNTNTGILAIGIHAGTPYYDCTTSFIQLMKKITEEQTSGQLTVSAPFLDWDKYMIYKYFTESKLPIDATYSCENGTQPPCGICASCLDRRKLKC